jgi:hypothetical protein
VPLLAVGGDLDDLTPLSDTPSFVPGLARTHRIVRLANTVHVTSEGDTLLSSGARCGRDIMRRFIRRPAALKTMDVGCASRIPPVHTPGAFPLTLGAATPAALAGGPDPGLDARRAATVAANAVADATIRRFYSGAGHGPGLRGGSFTAAGDEPVHFDFRADRFVGDAPMRGTATWRLGTGGVDARVVVRTPAGADVALTLHWTQRTARATATTGGARLTLPAP